jgi:hypothetical protein
MTIFAINHYGKRDLFLCDRKNKVVDDKRKKSLTIIKRRLLSFLESDAVTINNNCKK